MAKGFDLISSVYDICVRMVFGKRLNRFQSDSLKLLNTCESSVIIGGGSGLILKRAIERNLAKDYYYLELSDAMKKLSRNRLTHEEAVNTHFGTNLHDLPKKVESIVLPFILDCYHEATIVKMLHSYKTVLDRNGELLVIDFSLDQMDGSIWGFCKRWVLKFLYVFFNLIVGIEADRLPRIFKLLDEQGWVRLDGKQLHGGWIRAVIYTPPNI